MSELKSYDLVDIQDYRGEVYIKSEADKVISELKAQKAQAEDDCAYWKMREGNAANAMHETEEYAMQLYNELRHQKYRRCLDKAKWCIAEAKVSDDEYRMYWWVDWHKRWLELAEKFKEDLVIGVDKAIGTDKTVVINHEEAK